MTKPKKKKLTAREKKWLAEFNAEWMNRQNQRRRELLAKTTLEQRKIFIEKLREAEHVYGLGCFIVGWNEAREAAGIEDDAVAWAVYHKNSRPSKHRDLVKPEKVR